jgi:Lar family restriction alleviation protein
MTEELQPCPFCGGQATITKPNRGWGVSVGCEACGADIMRVDEVNPNLPDAAINAWNKRHIQNNP